MKAIGSAEGRKMGLPVRSVQEALGLAAADAECSSLGATGIQAFGTPAPSDAR